MSKYELITLPLISTCTNCYILVDKKTRAAAIIDPGCAPEQIIEAVKNADADVKMIINTQGHWDHIGANKAVAAATGAPIYIHRIDAPMLQDGELSLCKLFRGDGDGGEASRLLEDGDVIDLGDLQIKVILTPGHTKGGVCLYCEAEKIVFSGDTLFADGFGRMDLYGGSHKQMRVSLRMLLSLPEDVRLLPGHGGETTIGAVRGKYLR